MAIRDRLRELLFNVYEDGYTHGYERKRHRLTIRLSDSFYQKNIDQIIALFEEDRRIQKSTDYTSAASGANFMTGAEFYERFEKELEHLKITGEGTHFAWLNDTVIKAAKRASGVK